MKRIYIFFLLSCASACTKSPVNSEPLNFRTYKIDGVETDQNYFNATLKPDILVRFSAPVDKSTLGNAIRLYSDGTIVPIAISLINSDSTVSLHPEQELGYLMKYVLEINDQLKSRAGSELSSLIQRTFITKLDSTDKFPRVSDEELLTIIQKQTFRYFWDFGHPVSGLARERNTSGDLVTSGGSGFAAMAILVGIERGFISRQEGLDRLGRMTGFLLNKAKRYHGVFPHWLNGATGETIPFSQKDDGGDLVETSYLIAGLLTAKEYFNGPESEENNLRNAITAIWEAVEWDWHTRGMENVLYWHWSPNFNWEMNHELRGWNEALITYVLAASSPTHPISKTVYDKGWANNGAMKNNKSFYGIPLPLGPDFGGPLFFAHYSFLGIDPRMLKDSYADYWIQQVNHSNINYSYCVTNPRRYNGYSSSCWGLTASDNKTGYSAHSPTNDRGVISPTAALSSIHYTPEASMKALRFFYYTLGDKLFKQYGFVDAFSLSEPWFANSFLAIDQGPILIMMENHRTGLLWDHTMKNAHIRSGLTKLGFSY